MSKAFDEQILLPETESILANLFTDYWSTPLQREKILAKEKYDMSLIEEQKNIKYNSDNLFKKTINSVVSDSKVNENFNANLSIIIDEKNLFKKLIIFIRNLFKKTN